MTTARGVTALILSHVVNKALSDQAEKILFSADGKIYSCRCIINSPLLKDIKNLKDPPSFAVHAVFSFQHNHQIIGMFGLTTSKSPRQ